MASSGPEGSGSNGNGSGNVSVPVSVRKSPALEKLENDALKLIDVLRSIERSGEGQSLRVIAERTGLSKDEVNRYLNPQVNEVYNLDRLLHVRSRNRPLYNHLIVSGPPSVADDGRWSGITTNTSKFPLFHAMAQRFGWDVRFIGDRGLIVDLEYRGIEAIAADRMGKVFQSQEPILHLD